MGHIEMFHARVRSMCPQWETFGHGHLKNSSNNSENILFLTEIKDIILILWKMYRHSTICEQKACMQELIFLKIWKLYWDSTIYYCMEIHVYQTNKIHGYISYLTIYIPIYTNRIRRLTL